MFITGSASGPEVVYNIFEEIKIKYKINWTGTHCTENNDKSANNRCKDPIQVLVSEKFQT